MRVSFLFRSGVVSFAVALSAAYACAATIGVTVNEEAVDRYSYSWTIGLSAGASGTPVSQWSLPLVLGSPGDIDAGSVLTPYDYWNAEFVLGSNSGWSYLPSGDPAADGYADPAEQFSSPAWVLLFTFDPAARDSRASLLPGMIESLEQQIAMDLLRLQYQMTELNQMKETLDAMIHAGMPPQELLLQQRIIDEAEADKQRMIEEIQARQVELGELVAERDYALSGVDGIGPGMTGEFSLLSVLAPVAGPACLGPGSYLPTQVPYAPASEPVPEPGVPGLLALGGAALIRRRSTA